MFLAKTKFRERHFTCKLQSCVTRLSKESKSRLYACNARAAPPPLHCTLQSILCRLVRHIALLLTSIAKQQSITIMGTYKHTDAHTWIRAPYILMQVCIHAHTCKLTTSIGSLPLGYLPVRRSCEFLSEAACVRMYASYIMYVCMHVCICIYTYRHTYRCRHMLTDMTCNKNREYVTLYMYIGTCMMHKYDAHISYVG
jgi:hypothetical protein